MTNLFHGASWWRTPQRVWLRRAIFQIHLWLGLMVTLYAVVIGVSGSALVFREEIENAGHGELLHIPMQPGQANFEKSIRAIEAARPGYRAVGLEEFGRPDQAALILMQPEFAAPTPNYRQVTFNQYTGKVLLDRQRYQGFLGWMTNLHFYLLAGSSGLLVSGYMALSLLLLCVTGLVLWWPGVRRWAASLTLHKRARWQRLNWDLHSVTGFWCSASLAVFSFTGAYFAFPEPVAKMVVWITGGGAAPRPMANQTITPGGARLTIDQALSVISKRLPAEAPAGYLQLPSKPNSPYNATGYYKDTASYSQLVQVSIDPHTGAQLAYADTRNASRGMQIIQYFFAVHFGSFGLTGIVNIGVKSIWVLLGLVPPLLAVTGLLMYWNRKLKPLLRTLV